jgi:hypothetical protein
MENIRRAAPAGKVIELHAKAGDTLRVGRIILEFALARASSPGPREPVGARSRAVPRLHFA